MKIFRKRLLQFLLFSVVTTFCLGLLPTQSVMAYDAYVYSYIGEPRESLPIYLPQTQIYLTDSQNRSITQARDIVYDQKGNLYVSDAEHAQILIFNVQGKLEREITKYIGLDGKEESFSNPSGLCIHNGLLYVADTAKKSILVLDENNQVVKIVGSPSGVGITEQFVYSPISVAVDDSGRIYVASESSNMGVLCFTEDGVFEAFIGAQVVTPTATELFWRMFMTAEQRERSKKQIPTDYCDISMDEEGFLFAVSNSIDKNLQYNALVTRSISSDYAPVKRLSISGTDVLKRNGFYPPAGDIYLDTTVKREETVSAFAGVTVSEQGIYSVIDSTNKKIFTYDSDGNLLCAFGGAGSEIGKFISVTSITSYKNRLSVLDMNSSAITVFTLSDYGNLMLEAISLTNNRQYKEALEKWQEILPLNANLDNVYIDIGNAYLRNNEYQKAMEYFRIVQSKELYSEAFSNYRATYVPWLIVLLPLFAILLSVVFSKLFKMVKTRNTREDLNPEKKVRFTSELCYAGYTLFHPFDGFYHLKRHQRGGLRGAGVFLLWAVIAILMYRYLSGFLFSAGITSETNLFYDMFQLLFPFLAFVTANFCVTSLMDGEGSFGNILTVFCYSLLPVCLILPLCTLVANGLSLDESQLLNAAVIAAYIWSALLIVFGLQTIHGYSLGRNIIALLLTLVGMVVIMFLSLLAVAIAQKFVAFFYSFAIEVIWRF